MAEIIIDTTAAVGIIIAAIGLGSAIVYNAMNIKQNTRVHRYEIITNLYKKFHEIQNNVKDGERYQMETINLAMYTHEIIHLKIIPKHYVLTAFKEVFREGLWIANHRPEIKNDKDNHQFFDFCKNNQIEEKIPPSWTFK